MTEPVSAHTQRFVRSWWNLDRDLAYARHYPAITWSVSFSRDAERVAAWHAASGDAAWAKRRGRMLEILVEADRLRAVAELVGPASLPGLERIVLLSARLLREAVLQQSSLSINDEYCTPVKQAALADAVLTVTDRAHLLVEQGVPATLIEQCDFGPLVRARDQTAADDVAGVARHRRPRPDHPSHPDMTDLAPIEFTSVQAVAGPLVVVDGVDGVGWDEFVDVMLPTGDHRHGVVLERDRSLAVVQVLEGTEGIGTAGVRVSFRGSPLRIPVGEGWLGRVANGRGEPIDDGPPIVGKASADVNGAPLNPTVRVPPRDPVLTGVGVIDALTTLVRGQKLPIFSVGGLPHLELAAQIAAQAHVAGEPFAVVFAGMGLTHLDADAVRDTWRRALPAASWRCSSTWPTTPSSSGLSRHGWH